MLPSLSVVALAASEEFDCANRMVGKRPFFSASFARGECLRLFQSRAVRGVAN